MNRIFSQEDNIQSKASDFETLKAGEYLAKIIKVESDIISTKEDKGEKLVVTWMVQEGERTGKTVRQYFNLWAKNMKNIDYVQKIARDQFSKLRFITLGTDAAGFVKCAKNLSDFLERQAVIVIKMNEYNGVEYPEISYIKDIKDFKGNINTTVAAPQQQPIPQQPIYISPQQQPTYTPPVYTPPVAPPVAPQQPVQQPTYTPPVAPQQPTYTPPQQPQYQPPIQQQASYFTQPVIDDEIPF